MSLVLSWGSCEVEERNGGRRDEREEEEEAWEKVTGQRF